MMDKPETTSDWKPDPKLFLFKLLTWMGFILGWILARCVVGPNPNPNPIHQIGPSVPDQQSSFPSFGTYYITVLPTVGRSSTSV